jgi:hypothetical protein
MRTFSIDESNNITAFGTKKEAVSVSGLPFSSQKELAQLTAEWPISRFIEIWNGFAGVVPFGDLKPVKKFADRKVAVTRIWQAIQRLEAEGAASDGIEPEAPAEVVAAPNTEPIAPDAIAAVPAEATTDIEPAAPEATPEPASPAANAPVADATVTTEAAAADQPAPKQPKRRKAAKAESELAAPRESKATQVITMLQRPEGASITEIMEKMGWQKHTVRGFMAGAMKKAGYTVESFKPEGGERSYRINK